MHFEGDWQSAEVDVVKAAVAEAESAGLSSPPAEMGVPWVTTRQEVGSTTVFMACRWQGDSALVARSASDLADRILQFADAGEGEARSSAGEDGKLYQLVYESRAAPSLSDEDLQDILDEARSHNASAGLTGLLLYADGRFLQVLEGPKTAVQEVYTSIQNDARHTDVTTLLTTSLEERSFPGWQMGVETPETLSATDEASSTYLQTGTLPRAADPITDVLDALSTFRKGISEP